MTEVVVGFTLIIACMVCMWWSGWLAGQEREARRKEASDGE